MTCEERRDQMLLFAAGALEAAEETALRAHLSTGCATCAGSLAEAEATIQQIPRALPALVAPKGAWENLETRVALREQLEQPERVERMALAAVMTPRAAEGEGKGTGRWAGWAGWAAAAAILVVLGIPLGITISRVREQDKQIATLSETAKAVAAMQVRVAELEAVSANSKLIATSMEKDLREKDKQVESLMRSERYVVKAADGVEQPEVTGAIFLDAADNQAVVLATKVKALPAGETYVLWAVMADGKKLNVGAAKPDERGNLKMEAKIPADAGALAALAVTDEMNAGVIAAGGKLQFWGVWRSNSGNREWVWGM